MQNELTIRQAAKALGVKPVSVYAIVRKGWLKARRIGERVLLIDPASLATARARPGDGRRVKDSPAHGPFHAHNKGI